MLCYALRQEFNTLNTKPQNTAQLKVTLQTM